MWYPGSVSSEEEHHTSWNSGIMQWLHASDARAFVAGAWLCWLGVGGGEVEMGSRSGTGVGIDGGEGGRGGADGGEGKGTGGGGDGNGKGGESGGEGHTSHVAGHCGLIIWPY